MHMHTHGSFDCMSEPHALVERALRRGLDRICITDHNAVAVALELKRAYPDHVIVGEEVRTRERVDIIGLFLEAKIPQGTPARETCERIRAQGGIVYVPHPFASGKGGGGAILPVIEDLIDACEGFNARLHQAGLNDRAVAWGRARDLPLGAGSDAHTLFEVGRAWVELPAFAHEPRALLAALRRGTLHGTAAPHLVHVASTWAKAHKWLRGESRQGGS
ncbi:MAG TPA: PHP domain-containing protein [Longimicrobiales bacterium]|nr:PHP domain-containing protein [Longimicrobiales bacterium]